MQFIISLYIKLYHNKRHKSLIYLFLIYDIIARKEFAIQIILTIDRK